MFSRKSFKERGKKAFLRNWKVCIVVCFLYTFLVGGTIVFNYHSLQQNSYQTLKDVDISVLKNHDNNSEVVNDFLKQIKKQEPKNNPAYKTTKGVIGSFFNNVSQSGSYLFGLLNAINQFFFHDHLWASVIIIIGTVISFFYWLFVSKVLEVGYIRFFLENRKYTKTMPKALLYPFKINKICYIAYTMFLRSLFIFLWSFTIIGGIIKHYAYLLVPYILAEKQTLKPNEVLKLSSNMMKGHKWDLFKLDLSFIGWKLLGLLTLNVSNMLFTKPYLKASITEVYMSIREEAKGKNIINAKDLNDKYLEGDIENTECPINAYPSNYEKTKLWLKFNYKRKYSLVDIILLFFVFSFIGYFWEVMLYLFRTGEFVNRGALYGPWLPIYGSGGILLLILLKKYRDHPILYFFMAFIICGIVEFSTSVFLEIEHNLSWWDYNGYFLNIQGRVCLEGLLLFAAGGSFITYVVAPVLGNMLDKIPKKIKNIFSIIFVLLIACDFYASSVRPNQGNGVTNEINKELTFLQ